MNHYKLEATQTMPIFRIYTDKGKRTSAFIQFPEGKQTVPAELYKQAEILVDNKPF